MLSVVARLRWVQIPLKPASKGFGLHRVFIRSKRLKGLIADGASKRMQIEIPRACRLDADKHHRSFASWTGGAANCNKRSNGMGTLRLGHEGFPLTGGSATLSVTDGCRCGAVMSFIMRPQGLRCESIRAGFARGRSTNQPFFGLSRSTRTCRNSSGPLIRLPFRRAFSPLSGVAAVRLSIAFDASSLARSARAADPCLDLVRIVRPSSTSRRMASERVALFAVAHASTSVIRTDGIRDVT
jgi:hypothetical protein